GQQPYWQDESEDNHTQLEEWDGGSFCDRRISQCHNLLTYLPLAASSQDFLAGSVLSRGASSQGTSTRNRPPDICPLARAFGCNTQLQCQHWQLDEWKQVPRHCLVHSQTILSTIPFHRIF